MKPLTPTYIFTVAMLQDPPHLSYAVSFLPLARSSQMLDYYTNIKQEKLCDDTTEIVAMDLGECGLTRAGNEGSQSFHNHGKGPFVL